MGYVNAHEKEGKIFIIYAAIGERSTKASIFHHVPNVQVGLNPTRHLPDSRSAEASSIRSRNDENASMIDGAKSE